MSGLQAPETIREQSVRDLLDRIDRAARKLAKASENRGASLWRRDLSRSQVEAASRAVIVARREWDALRVEAVTSLLRDLEDVPVEREVAR